MFRYLNVFPKQHHFLSGELAFPVVLVLPYTLLKELKRWHGENHMFRSPGDLASVCLGRAHFPAVWIAKLRSWG